MKKLLLIILTVTICLSCEKAREDKSENSNQASRIVRLNLIIDNGILPDYTSKTARTYSRRAVIEVYHKGAEELINRYTKIINQPVLELNIQPGEYDVLLWIDYIPIYSLHSVARCPISLILNKRKRRSSHRNRHNSKTTIR